MNLFSYGLQQSYSQEEQIVSLCIKDVIFLLKNHFTLYQQ